MAVAGGPESPIAPLDTLRLQLYGAGSGQPSHREARKIPDQKCFHVLQS